MMAKETFASGSTWQQVRETFDDLRKRGAAGAADVVETLDYMALPEGNPHMELEDEVLGVFRERLRAVLDGHADGEAE